MRLPSLLLLAACTADNAAPDVAEEGQQDPSLLSSNYSGANGPLPDGVDLDTDFEVLFCPDDPVTTLELALIDRVREARLADAGDYEEGGNPYTIRYAVYNLRNLDVTEGLIAADDAGVDVQVLIEQDQLDEDRTWNEMDELLIDAGFELAPDHRYMSAEERYTADLVVIGGSGLMHLKTRLYSTPEGTTLLTGSMNPGDNATLNDETLHLVHIPEVVEAYEEAYYDVLHRGDIDNEWDDDDAVHALFSPADSGPTIGNRILQWLSEEDEQILLMVYSLRDITAGGVSGSLIDILAERVAAGVPVYVLTDQMQSDGYYDTTEDELRSIGVHVWEVSNTTTEYTAMHHKVAVLGRTDIRVITDAANWTKSGVGSSSSSGSNVESALFIETTELDGGRTGQRYLGQWMRVLAKYADTYGPADGEPGFWEVYAALTTQDGWPDQGVHFAADDVYTSWGEGVYVRGDHESLGDWGATGGGLPLTTDSASYPYWWSERPAVMPLGTPFEWKLVASYEGSDGARWESGDNRTGHAMPTVLVDDDYEESGSWR